MPQKLQNIMKTDCLIDENCTDFEKEREILRSYPVPLAECARMMCSVLFAAFTFCLQRLFFVCSVSFFCLQRFCYLQHTSFNCRASFLFAAYFFICSVHFFFAEFLFYLQRFFFVCSVSLVGHRSYFVVLQTNTIFGIALHFLKHQISSRNLKQSFRGNSVKISDCRAFSPFKTLPGCLEFRHGVKNIGIQVHQFLPSLPFLIF